MLITEFLITIVLTRKRYIVVNNVYRLCHGYFNILKIQSI